MKSCFGLMLATVICLMLNSQARGTMVEIPVTPASLEQHDYVFSVEAGATNDAVTFHIAITNKNYDIYGDSGVYVCVITHEKPPGGGLEISSHGVQPDISVSVEKEPRVWRATFTAPRELLKNPDAYFTYNVLAHSVINGKTIAMPSVTCYELRLRDFAKP